MYYSLRVIKHTNAFVFQVLPPEARVIRVMPNTPALVKEGAAALSRGSRATPEDAKLASQLFQAVGTCDEVPEYQMDAITALSGSGPAYVSSNYKKKYNKRKYVNNYVRKILD